MSQGASASPPIAASCLDCCVFSLSESPLHIAE
jgi:hypothetical protein